MSVCKEKSALPIDYFINVNLVLPFISVCLYNFQPSFSYCSMVSMTLSLSTNIVLEVTFVVRMEAICSSVNFI